MIRKTLTYLTILAITALPVQLINAGVEVISMKMSMNSHQMTQTENQCMLDDVAQQHAAKVNTNSMDKSCCDDQSHSCQSCDNCPQAITAMLLTTDDIIKPLALRSHDFVTSYLFLDGVSQQNLLRPPRI